MKYKTILPIIIIAFIIGCNPQEDGTSNQNDRPVPPKEEPSPPEPEPDPSSFSGRTKNYDMLGVQASKDWLQKNAWTVTDSDNTIILQRDYQSGNVTDRSRISISKEGAMVSRSGTMFTTDDDGNIRVGFFRQ